MSVIIAQDVRTAAKGEVNESNLASVLAALDKYGDRFGSDVSPSISPNSCMRAATFATIERSGGQHRRNSATTPAPISATRRRGTVTAISTAVEPGCSSRASTERQLHRSIAGP